mmetsp:Transcript_2172/g.3330  ORF Transcript_2172/g.3330 Transcript_2172/m.3330 type:complete len:81 (+) Transcript_2172:46-288(+)
MKIQSRSLPVEDQCQTRTFRYSVKDVKMQKSASQSAYSMRRSRLNGGTAALRGGAAALKRKSSASHSLAAITSPARLLSK